MEKYNSNSHKKFFYLVVIKSSEHCNIIKSGSIFCSSQEVGELKVKARHPNFIAYTVYEHPTEYDVEGTKYAFAPSI